MTFPLIVGTIDDTVTVALIAAVAASLSAIIAGVFGHMNLTASNAAHSKADSNSDKIDKVTTIVNGRTDELLRELLNLRTALQASRLKNAEMTRELEKLKEAQG